MGAVRGIRNGKGVIGGTDTPIMTVQLLQSGHLHIDAPTLNKKLICDCLFSIITQLMFTTFEVRPDIAVASEPVIKKPDA